MYFLIYNKPNINNNAQPNISRNTLKNISIPNLSLEIQQEIINKIEKFENYNLQYIEYAKMIKEELDNYIQNINDNIINENVINESDNESEVDLEIEIEDSE